MTKGVNEEGIDMLPIKTRILQLAIEWNRPFTAAEMADVLKKEYNNEGTTAVKEVDKQLEMYCRVNMLVGVHFEFDKDDNLIVSYQITDTGERAKKYIPGM